MATLTNEKIKLTYAGLIKTNDSGAIGAVAKPLTDGLGNAINMEVLTGQINFPSGVVDFTGSTVNGLPIEPAGLLSGTGLYSMTQTSTIAPNSSANGTDGCIALGWGALANTGAGNVAVGPGAQSNGQFSLAVGRAAKANNGAGTALGNDAQANGNNSLAMMYSARAAGQQSIGIGQQCNSSGNNSIVLGSLSNASATGSVALGYQVTAAIANTVSVKALEVQTDSTPAAGGIIMSDAGGTDRRINIDAAGALQIDSTPVGVKFAASDITVVQEVGPSASDVILLNAFIPANTFSAGDIINIKAMLKADYTGGGNNYFGIGFSTTSGTQGTAFASAFSSVSQAIFFDRTIVINTVDGTGLGTTMLSADQSIDQNADGKYCCSDGVNGVAFDWTVDQYLYLQTYSEGTGSFVESRMLTIAKIN